MKQRMAETLALGAILLLFSVDMFAFAITIIAIIKKHIIAAIIFAAATYGLLYSQRDFWEEVANE